MTRDQDALERLCQRVREHEEPDASDRAFVRQQLALRIAAAGVGAAGVIGATKSAAASGAAPALAASGSNAMVSAGGALKAWSLAAAGAWTAGGASAALVVALVVQSLPSAAPVQAASPPPSAVAMVIPAPKPAAAPSRRAMALPTQPVAAPATASPPARVAAPNQVAVSKRSQAPESPLGAPKPSLAQEAAGLARVQRALRDSDPNLALALLDEQDQLYRTGSLGSERAAARALAWCAAGHRTRARTLAERVVAENAGSPLADRVKRKCLGTRSSP